MEGMWRERETDRRKMEKGDSSHVCLLFSGSDSTSGRAYPQAIPLLEFTVKAGLPANKTHVDLQRNGEGQGPENSLSLYPGTHMHAQEQLNSNARIL